MEKIIGTDGMDHLFWLSLVQVIGIAQLDGEAW